MMTKSATLGYLGQKTSLSKKQIGDILDELLALACKEAKNGFVVPGFGKLVLANRKARIGRNPQTGEPLKIPAKRVCKFRITKSLKDAVLEEVGPGQSRSSRLLPTPGAGVPPLPRSLRRRSRGSGRGSAIAPCRTPATRVPCSSSRPCPGPRRARSFWPGERSRRRAAPSA